MNPFPNPETVDPQINQEVSDYIDNQLEATGKVMFYDAMEMLEKAIDAKELSRSKIFAWYITRSLLKSGLPDSEKSFLISGIKDQVDSLEEGRDPQTYSEHR